ncbi:MAG: AAA family ATPase, partial [Anaerolineaceae bacterium]
MRFKSVRVARFGCLEDEKLELASGLNVIYGLNEAGKSTWHAAMYAALCGVRRGAGITKTEREFREKHFPWSGKRWEVNAQIELEDGRLIDLHHDLDGKVDCKATNAVTGRDMSPELMFEGMPDGSTLLGLNRNLYSQVGCIRQAEILSILNDSHELQVQIQRTVASPEAKATAAAAIKALQAFRSAKVGLDRSNSSQPLVTTRRALQSSAQCLRQASAAHESYALVVSEAVRLERLADERTTRRTRLEAQIRTQEADALGAKIDRMKLLAAGLPDGPPPDRREEDGLALRVAEAIKAWTVRPDIVVPAGETAEELTRQLGELPEPAAGDTETDPAVVDAEMAWRASKAVFESHLAVKPTAPEASGSAADAWQLRQLADTLRVQEQPIPSELERAVALARERVARASSPARRNLMIAVGLSLAVLGAAAVALGLIWGFVALAAGIALAGIGALNARPVIPLWRAVQEQTQAEESLGSAQAERVKVVDEKDRAALRAAALDLVPVPDELVRRAEEIESSLGSAAQVGVWEARRLVLSHEHDERTAALASALLARGEAASADVGATVDSYKRACSERANRATLAARRPDLEARLKQRFAADEQSRKDRIQTAEAAEALSQVAEKLGLTIETEDKSIEELRAWLATRGSRQAADDASRSEWEELSALRRDGSEDARRQRLADLRSAVAALNPDGNVVEFPVGADANALVEEARKLEADAKDEAREMEGRRAQLARTVPSVSEAEESLEAATEAYAHVQDLANVVDTTIRFLSDAEERVQRDIAPVLSKFVEPRLAQVTNGRYAQVAVDPADLSVTVVDSSGAHRSAARLSHGTSEQVYLLLRVALAEIFGRSGESVPLLLDDVTVESDRIRTQAILSVLLELSATHQIVL